MQTESTLSVRPGEMIIPMYNGLTALISSSYLKFYQWTMRFEQLAAVYIDKSEFDSDITVTHENKILICVPDHSLRTYSLRWKIDEEKYSVTTRLIRLERRDKRWIDENAIAEPYFIGHGRDTREMLFFVETRSGPFYVAADIGINTADYKFWCILQNRIICYDGKSLFYFALTGEARVHKMDVESTDNIENYTIGTTTAIRMPTHVYIFWGASYDYDCTVVETTHNILIIGDKYAILGPTLEIYDARNNQIGYSSGTEEIIRSSTIVSSWAPMSTIAGSTPVNSSRGLGSPTRPQSSRSRSSQHTGQDSMLLEKMPTMADARQSGGKLPVQSAPQVVPQTATQAASVDARVSVSAPEATSVPKLILPSDNGAPRPTRRPSGGMIGELVRRKSSKGSMVAGNKLLTRAANGDLKVIITDKI